MSNNPKLANQLLAASIHEIKNRFGLMFSQLDQLLAELPLDPHRSHTADLIKSEAEFIGNELVRVLVAYKSLDHDLEVNQDQQFLVDFLEEKVARHTNTAKANDLTLDFDCDEDLDGFFDGGVVNIVLDTCIYNAAKEGAKRILLKAEQPDGFLRIQIHDDGPGFPDSMLQQGIQLGQLKQETASTGLGLYLAQNLVSQHQEGDKTGYIELGKSDILGGACVTIFLPQ